MREICFRGKRLNNGKWVEGYFFRQYGSNEIITADNEIYHVAPESVGEYTGMKDIHGMRIFEGDIVSVDEPIGDTHKGVVVLEYNFCSFVVETNYNYSIPFNPQLRYEIIGNIHDNPELLKIII